VIRRTTIQIYDDLVAKLYCGCRDCYDPALRTTEELEAVRQKFRSLPLDTRKVIVVRAFQDAARAIREREYADARQDLWT
jgi:hypothetical protein